MPRGPVPLTGRIEDSFRRQLDALPAPARQLLLLAAADPSGDPALVLRAAGRLGLPAQEAAEAAAEAGLAEFGARVRFRHPLVRSVGLPVGAGRRNGDGRMRCWRRRPIRRRTRTGGPGTGPRPRTARMRMSRRSWRPRRAGRRPAAGWPRPRRSWSARSLLTVDPARRGERTVAAAQASLQAGAFGKALGLLVMAEAGPLDELQGARVDLLRGQIAFASGLGGDAPPLLLKAATRLEPLDLDLARETYLSAWGAAVFAGRLAGAGDLREVSRAARAAPAPAHPPRPVDLLLDGLALAGDRRPCGRGTGAAAGGSCLRQRGRPRRRAAPVGLAGRLRAAVYLWDVDSWLAISAGATQLARDVGALDQLPIDLQAQAAVATWCGDFPAAAALITEARLVSEATGTLMAPFAAMLLAALRGRESEAAPLIEATFARSHGRGPGNRGDVGALGDRDLVQRPGPLRRRGGRGRASQPGHARDLCLGVGAAGAGRGRRPHREYPAGGRCARSARGDDPARRDRLGAGHRGPLPRAGQRGPGRGGAVPGGDRPARPDPAASELARAHLLYGEWLRRENRRTDAREQLRTAHDMLDEIGMEAFAERARRELLATGETARKRTASRRGQPGTDPQEAQVARLARDGLSNPEIGARLFISAHTVQYHLSKVFAKLGITSRGQLHRALPGDPDAPGS